MADFNNKKIRKLFEEEVVGGSAGDLSLLIALTRKALKAELARVAALAETENVDLDPLPVKLTANAKADE